MTDSDAESFATLREAIRAYWYADDWDTTRWLFHRPDCTTFPETAENEECACRPVVIQATRADTPESIWARLMLVWGS